jgi:flagellar biogenesis protein FliO
MDAAVRAWARGEHGWAQVWRWLRGLRRARPARQLRLRETLGLGERRFLAVAEFERQRFLIAGTANSVSLLAELGERDSGEGQDDTGRR